jgi:hypothetical protein
MGFVDCEGYMIPGLYFEKDYCAWLLRWAKNPTKSQYLTEVWIFYPDGKRVSYVDPENGVDFFKKYHSFDEVIGTSINISESKGKISIEIDKAKIKMEISTGFSLIYSLINLILSDKNKLVGKTETGKITENFTHKLEKVTNAHIMINNQDLGKLAKIKKDIFVGESKASKDPLVSYCTLRIEE